MKGKKQAGKNDEKERKGNEGRREVEREGEREERGEHGCRQRRREDEAWMHKLFACLW